MKKNRPSHEDFKKLAFKKPDVESLYHELEEEYHLLEEMIHARHKAGKTQAEVAELMGIKTSAVGRLESSLFYKNHSPTLMTLKKYAHALGYKLELNLVPNDKENHHL
jgi:DNA-binding XRE family transcriptional regulator